MNQYGAWLIFDYATDNRLEHISTDGTVELVDLGLPRLDSVVADDHHVWVAGSSVLVDVDPATSTAGPRFDLPQYYGLGAPGQRMYATDRAVIIDAPATGGDSVWILDLHPKDAPVAAHLTKPKELAGTLPRAFVAGLDDTHLWISDPDRVSALDLTTILDSLR